MAEEIPGFKTPTAAEAARLAAISNVEDATIEDLQLGNEVKRDSIMVPSGGSWIRKAVAFRMLNLEEFQKIQKDAGEDQFQFLKLLCLHATVSPKLTMDNIGKFHPMTVAQLGRKIAAWARVDKESLDDLKKQLSPEEASLFG